MLQPLFSTYSQGENRVTATIMAVFERVNSGLVEEILARLLDESELSLLEFETQIRGEASVPDGAVRASTTVYLETKTTPGVIDHDQLERHLVALLHTWRIVTGYFGATASTSVNSNRTPPAVLSVTVKSHP